MPVDPTPEALARDPEVDDALRLYMREMFDSSSNVNPAPKLITVILARYRATRATSGPILDFEKADNHAINSGLARGIWGGKAFCEALEAQAQERCAALEARIKELEVAGRAMVAADRAVDAVPEGLERNKALRSAQDTFNVFAKLVETPR